MGERRGLERWRLQEIRFRVTGPFKVGWLHLTGKNVPRRCSCRRGEGAPEQMLPFWKKAPDYRRVQKPPPPIKAPDSPALPNPGDKVIKKQLSKQPPRERCGHVEQPSLPGDRALAPHPGRPGLHLLSLHPTARVRKMEHSQF